MKARDIVVKPISVRDARSLVCKYHYSKRFVMNSKINLGVFLNGVCGGVMQYGRPADPGKTQKLVKGTSWSGFLELNRMALAPWMPKNSESRSLGVSLRMIKKEYPHIDWIVSFSDACQCGDGAIYRASGFVLTGITKNKTLFKLPDGKIISDLTVNTAKLNGKNSVTALGKRPGETGASFLRRMGAVPLEGYQLRYVYFLNKEARSRLTVEEIPFSRIQELGAGMYKGEKR